MAKNNGGHAAPEKVPPSRLTVAQVLPTIIFPMIGCLLYLVGGMEVTDIFKFLAGCGAIGATVTVLPTGGRRARVAIARLLANTDEE